jgi:hypothetical protein
MGLLYAGGDPISVRAGGLRFERVKRSRGIGAPVQHQYRYRRLVRLYSYWKESPNLKMRVSLSRSQLWAFGRNLLACNG